MADCLACSGCVTSAEAVLVQSHSISTLREYVQKTDANDAALVFTCNGRGHRLFGEADHDARRVSDAVGGGPVAGMFCAGEIGPVGGENHVHGFTASTLFLFG